VFAKASRCHVDKNFPPGGHNETTAGVAYRNVPNVPCASVDVPTLRHGAIRHHSVHRRVYPHVVRVILDDVDAFIECARYYMHHLYGTAVDSVVPHRSPTAGGHR